MTSPADELRAAADTLRSLTTDATEGPWAHEDPNTRWGDDHDHQLIGGGKILATFNNNHNGPLNALYTAAMSPNVGTALADWLTREAELWDLIETVKAEYGPQGLSVTTPLSTHAQALAVARAITGGQP